MLKGNGKGIPVSRSGQKQEAYGQTVMFDASVTDVMAPAVSTILTIQGIL